MAKVRIPVALRRYTDGRDIVSARGDTVAEVIDELERQHPGLRASLLDGGAVRGFVNIYVGDDDIRFLDGLATKLDDEACLTILPGIAGG